MPSVEAQFGHLMRTKCHCVEHSAQWRNRAPCRLPAAWTTLATGREPHIGHRPGASSRSTSSASHRSPPLGSRKLAVPPARSSRPPRRVPRRHRRARAGRAPEHPSGRSRPDQSTAPERRPACRKTQAAGLSPAVPRSRRRRVASRARARAARPPSGVGETVRPGAERQPTASSGPRPAPPRARRRREGRAASGWAPANCRQRSALRLNTVSKLGQSDKWWRCFRADGDRRSERSRPISLRRPAQRCLLPVTSSRSCSRSHRRWCFHAQPPVTVPRVIARMVPRNQIEA